MNKKPLEGLIDLNTKPENRKIFTQQLINQPQLIEEVIQIAGDKKNEIAGKAARALELVCKKSNVLIFKHKTEIYKLAKNSNRDDIIRPIAKIFELWTLNFYSKNPSILFLPNDKEKITAICFDWIITPQKVAPQAYSMQTLFLLGKEIDWVHQELKLILEQNYASGTSAYKARARKIIGKIEKQITS